MQCSTEAQSEEFGKWTSHETVHKRRVKDRRNGLPARYGLTRCPMRMTLRGPVGPVSPLNPVRGRHGAGDICIGYVPDAQSKEPTDTIIRVTRASIK